MEEYTNDPSRVPGIRVQWYDSNPVTSSSGNVKTRSVTTGIWAIVNFENYTGGAHGAHAYNHFVIDLKNGKKLKEEDIFIDSYQEQLAAILVAQIAKQNNVTDPKELENMGFFSVDEIYPNNNFLIDETGITYTFNEYEIAAYVVGPIHVHIPFEDVQLLLKQDSPIASLAGL